MADFLYPIPRQEALRHALDGDGQTNQRRSIAKEVERQILPLARARDLEEQEDLRVYLLHQLSTTRAHLKVEKSAGFTPDP